MKRAVVFLITVAVVLTGASSRLPEPEPVRVEGISCSGLYQRFINQLESAEVLRTELCFDSLLDAVGYTREETAFAPREDGLRELTYRQLQPLVFWDHPQSDYFDGEQYYYSHRNNWYVDQYNRFEEHLRADFMGIPLDFLEGDDPIVRDEVFLQNNTYYGYMTTESADGTLRQELAAEIDLAGNFHEITITTHAPKEEGLRTYKQYLRIRYQNVNQPVTVTPPEGLDPNKLANVPAQTW